VAGTPPTSDAQAPGHLVFARCQTDGLEVLHVLAQRAAAPPEGAPGTYRASSPDPAVDLNFTQRQADGLEVLHVLAQRAAAPPEGTHRSERVSSLRRSSHLRVGRNHRRVGAGHSAAVETEKATPGALAAEYHLPQITYRNNYVPWLLAVSIALVVRMAYHSYSLAHDIRLGSTLLAVLVFSVAFATFQQLISWKDRPRSVTARQQAQLDALKVVVAVPVYNEDPELLDRAIWSLANSSRPPDVVHVVEDGEQKVSYRALREHWTRIRRPGFAVIWTRNPVNQGKKWAQSEVFLSHPDADVFITIDSDTSLEFNAIHEGLKPFAEPSITSVAGIEVMYNSHINWLTRSVTSRNIVYQLVTWGAQSALGDLLVNRGTYALYRAWVIREIVPAYLAETFLGLPIRLGDDAALALFARDRGRTVQQVTAFSLPMCAESFSHHFRQFTRWMRGKVIRDEWRLRYLPVFSYGWLYTVLTIFGVLVSTATAVLIIAFLPATAWLLRYTLAVLVLASLVTGTRVFCIRRSDESAWDRIVSWIIYPSALLWVLFVLRPLRFYGAATWFKQGWVTRQTGVEVGLRNSEPSFPGQAVPRERVMT
jgi:hyaluronan synthase